MDGPFHGGTGGELHTFMLYPGERIVGFRGRSGWQLDRIQFLTSTGISSNFRHDRENSVVLFQVVTHRTMVVMVEAGLKDLLTPLNLGMWMVVFNGSVVQSESNRSWFIILRIMAFC
jgi:hypothetical protein